VSASKSRLLTSLTEAYHDWCPNELLCAALCQTHGAKELGAGSVALRITERDDGWKEELGTDREEMGSVVVLVSSGRPQEPGDSKRRHGGHFGTWSSQQPLPHSHI
jgi:hypothetical protein